MGIAFVFPGQGSQAVGMGADLFAHFPASVQPIFDAFDQALAASSNPLPEGQSLAQLMADGPEECLKRTCYTQPAIAAVSVAALEVLKSQSADLKPTVVAGHSIGELPALYSVGCLSLSTLATLVVKRGALMETAPSGAMAAVLGLKADAVEATLNTLALSEGELVVVANDNSPEQVVISGTQSGVDAACVALKEAGAKRVIPLAVGGAYHSPLVQASGDAFATYLAQEAFEEAQVPLISNIDAAASKEGSVLQQKLSRQIPGAVRWTATMESLAKDFNVNTVIELGHGKVISGLFRKSGTGIKALNVQDKASLEATLEGLASVQPQAVC